MILDLIEYSFVGFSLFSASGVGIVRFKNRKKKRPEWRQARLEHFLTQVDLPSTCSLVGHSMLSDGQGCEHCEDLIKIPAESCSDFYVLREPKFDLYEYADPNDARIVDACLRPKRYGLNSEGHIWVDPNAHYEKERYNHRQTGLTRALRYYTL